jgi:galactan endo-1,6-beta-galactosidase
MSLAANLNLDFFFLQMDAWVYWQALDSGGWGLIQCNINSDRTAWLGTPNTKYFVLAQYTRHIRPGFSILLTSDKNLVAAYSASEQKLVLIVTNDVTTARWLNVDISAFNFTQPNATIPRWETNTQDGGKQYAYALDTQLQNGGTVFWSYFQPLTVQTFEISGTSQMNM